MEELRSIEPQRYQKSKRQLRRHIFTSLQEKAILSSLVRLSFLPHLVLASIGFVNRVDTSLIACRHLSVAL